MSDGKVTIDTRLDTSGIEAGLANLKTSLSRIGKIIATAFSVRQILRFGKSAIDMAADLTEVQNVVDTAFGSMSYKMEEFADKAIETYGISKLTAKQMGSTFMAMASGMGIAMDSASDMAIALIGLSADMASFYNVSADVASTALKSVFTGETETLKRFGIVMTEANLQAFAMSQGITKSINSMTQAEKVQLRYNYVMSQTTLAQGDFAKTADSWSNQVRILTERWKEFLSILGNGLIQVLTPALRALNNLLATLINIANALAKTFGFSTIKSSQATASTMEDLAMSTDNAASATKKLSKAQKGLSNLEDLNVISSASGTGASGTGGGGITGSSLAQIADATEQTEESTSPLMKALEKLQDISLDNLIKSFDHLKDSLSQLGGHIADGLYWLYTEVLVPLSKWTIEDALPASINLLASAIDILNAVIETAKPLIEFLWNNFLEPIASFTGGIIVGVLNDLAGILEEIANNKVAVTVLTTFLGAFATAKGFVKGVELVQTLEKSLGGVGKLGKIGITITVALVGWEIGQNIYKLITGDDTDYGTFTDQMKEIVGWIGEKIPQVFNSMKNVLLNGLTIIKNTVGTVVSFIGDGFSTAFNGIKAMWNTAGSFFGVIFNSIKNVFSPTVSFFKNTFSNALTGIKSVFNFGKMSNIFSGIVNGIHVVFGGIPAWFKSEFTKAWTNVKNVFSSAGTIFINIKDGIVTAFKSIVNGLIAGIEKAVNTPFTTINNALSSIKNFKILGKKPFSKLPTIPQITMPRLATGAVIPPNKEFMAILGDQKRGTNIEAPLDTIVEAMQIALSERQNEVTFKVEGDPYGLFKVVQEKAYEYNRTKGRPAF